MRLSLRQHAIVNVLSCALVVPLVATGCRTTRQTMSNLPGMSWVSPGDNVTFEEYADDSTVDIETPSEKAKPYSVAQERSKSQDGGKYPDTGYPSPYSGSKDSEGGRYDVADYDSPGSSEDNTSDRGRSGDLNDGDVHDDDFTGSKPIDDESESVRTYDTYSQKAKQFADDAGRAGEGALNSARDAVDSTASTTDEYSDDDAVDQRDEFADQVQREADEFEERSRDIASGYAEQAQSGLDEAGDRGGQAFDGPVDTAREQADRWSDGVESTAQEGRDLADDRYSEASGATDRVADDVRQYDSEYTEAPATDAYDAAPNTNDTRPESRYDDFQADDQSTPDYNDATIDEAPLYIPTEDAPTADEALQDRPVADPTTGGDRARDEYPATDERGPTHEERDADQRRGDQGAEEPWRPGSTSRYPMGRAPQPNRGKPVQQVSYQRAAREFNQDQNWTSNTPCDCSDSQGCSSCSISEARRPMRR